MGRNENENKIIDSLIRSGDCRLEAVDFGSPVGLLRGEADLDALKTAASVVARYSDGKSEKSLEVSYRTRESDGILEASPAVETELVEIRV